jgi:bla regulator protein BlaR1
MKRHTGLLFVAILLTLSSPGPLRGREGEGRRSGGDTYVLYRGSNSSMNGTLEGFEELRRRYAGDFLWFRRAGSAYVIRDPRLLSEAEGLFDPVRKLEPEQEAISRQQAALDREEEEIDREQEAIEAEQEDSRDTDVPRDRSAALERRHRALEVRRRDLRRRQRPVAAEERALDRRSEQIEQAAERKLWDLIDRAIRSGAASNAR